MGNNYIGTLKTVNLSDENEKRNYNRTLFDTVAPAYNKVTIVLSFGRDKAWKALLKKSLPEGDSLVCADIACGTADITKILSESYPNGDVVGIDLNESMINHAKLSNEHKNIRFEIGDMCNLTLEDGSIDVLTGGYALRNAPDLLKALSEFHRVMRPGGKALFLDFSKPKNRFLASIEYGLLKFWGSLWGLLFHGNADVYGYIADSLMAFPHSKRLEEMLRDSGFVDVTSRPLLFGFLALTTVLKDRDI